jgi:Tn3 transposase DDE domain
MSALPPPLPEVPTLPVAERLAQLAALTDAEDEAPEDAVAEGPEPGGADLRCVGTTAGGQPCGMFRMRGSQFCRHHDPDARAADDEAREEARRQREADRAARTASPSLILHLLGSYARQHSVHQALNEIGRAERTIHILRTLDEEAYRRRQARELNKGEAAHELSRFLFFGKEGTLRGRGFEDQLHSFSCLGVLHNAVVAWNLGRLGPLVAQLRAEGHAVEEATLALTTPLLRKHLNPFGRYHFDLRRMRQTLAAAPPVGG